MTAPMVPAPVATTPAAPAAAQATEVTSDNFLLMLGQLLGAPVAQAAGKPATAAQTSASESDAEAATQDAALVTGVPIPMMTTPVQPQGLAVEMGEAIAAPAVTAARAGAVSVEAGLSRELLQAESADESGQQSPGATQAPPTQLPTTDMSHQLRVAASPDPGPTRTLHHSVGSSAWADELGTRMLLMSDRGQHSASLRLNPEHLGPLEVRISVRDDQASVWFGSSQADTRAALEQALPRLRELFASQGLSLADTGVHHQAPREPAKFSAPAGDSQTGSGETEVSTTAVAVKLGLVDAYA